jgi:hypothetical protein
VYEALKKRLITVGGTTASGSGSFKALKFNRTL